MYGLRKTRHGMLSAVWEHNCINMTESVVIKFFFLCVDVLGT